MTETYEESLAYAHEIMELTQPLPHFDGKGKSIDYVNHPPHYSRLSPEPIDVIESWDLGHHEATALAYIARARFKGHEQQDLEKAVWYLNRRIAQLKETP